MTANQSIRHWPGGCNVCYRPLSWRVLAISHLRIGLEVGTPPCVWEEHTVNHSPRKDQISDAAQEILAYLIKHPRAQDTLEGIVQWWLLEQEIQYWIAKAQAALAELVARGLALERRGADGQTRYRINRRRIKEIRALLGQK